MANTAELSADSSADNPTLRSLLSRYSLGVKHLGDPGPSSEQLRLMAEAALHGPDHAELVPFRVKIVRGEGRERLATLFERAAREAGKDEAAAALDAERARRAPVTVAVIARIDLGHPQVPAHEQWVAVGAALANYMNALHALGYAGKMLSGAKVRQPSIVAAFCQAGQPGETLLGWIAIGTPLRALATRAPKSTADEVSSDW